MVHNDSRHEAYQKTISKHARARISDRTISTFNEVLFFVHCVQSATSAITRFVFQLNREAETTILNLMN